MTFAVGVAQDLPLPDDASFDVVTCTLAIHHVPARQRPRAFEEMYRVTRPGGRLLAADIDTARPPLPLHPGARRTRRAVASAGPLEELAAAAGYRVESAGKLPLLRYIVAVRPSPGTRPLTAAPRSYPSRSAPTSTWQAMAAAATTLSESTPAARASGFIGMRTA